MRGIHDVTFLVNTNVVARGHMRQHPVVVGGSYVGLEFARMQRRFDAEVMIVERADRLIPREDPEISDAVWGDPRG